MPEETKPAAGTTALSTPTPQVSTPSRATAPVAKTPPAEELKGSFDSPSDLEITEYKPEGVESKPTEEKPTAKPAEKTLEPSKEVKPSTETPPAKPVNPLLSEAVKPPDSTRDYTGFTEGEVTILKNMSKQSFDAVSKIIKENKELAKLKDSTYLQNPEAYRLDPAYAKTAEDIQYISSEAQIWRNQLINIKAGKEWTPFLGWDKAGNPVYDKKRPAGEMDEEDVRQRMNQCNQSVQQMQGQLTQMQQTYATRVQTDNTVIDEVQKAKFSWVSDPALADKTVAIPSLGERSIKQIQLDFKELLPVYHRGSKLAELGANMFAGLMVYASRIRELESQLQIAQTNKGDALRAEPTSTERPANTNGVPKSKFGGPDRFDTTGLPD